VKAPTTLRPSGEANAALGNVRAVEYQGSYVKVTLDLSWSEEFVANISDVEFFRDPLEIGDRVLARWSAADLRMLEGNLEASGAQARQPFDALSQ
jgi:putative spermidine/putrescine transport system ATP-binding protein